MSLENLLGVIATSITVMGALGSIGWFVWRSGKCMGGIKSKLQELDATLVLQRSTGDGLAGEMAEKVDQKECNRTHDMLNEALTTIHTRIDTLYTERADSEARILSAIQALGRVTTQTRSTIKPRK